MVEKNELSVCYVKIHKKGAKAKTRISFPLKPEFSKLENSERLDRKQLFLIPKTNER